MPPDDILAKASPTKRQKFFIRCTETGKWIPRPTSRRYMKPGTKSIEKIIGVNTGGPEGRRQNEQGHTKRDYQLFLDFIMKMLVYDPEKRIGPRQAQQHEFSKAFERRYCCKMHMEESKKSSATQATMF